MKRHRRRPRSSGDHLRILLIGIFEACRLKNPDFETKFIDFFLLNVIKAAFIAPKMYLPIMYILLGAHLE